MILDLNVKKNLLNLFEKADNKKYSDKIIIEMNNSVEKPVKYYLGKMNSELVLMFNHECAINFLCSTNAYTSVRDFSETFGISEEGVTGKFIEVSKDIADMFYNGLDETKITDPYSKLCYKNYVK